MTKHSRKPRRQSRFVLTCFVALQFCVVLIEVVEAITGLLGGL
ncbi:hypothetical protein [Lentzea sp. NBRC 102530]|nr:hypothetical protein [Lentzea sp. NBRC 102530]